MTFSRSERVIRFIESYCIVPDGTRVGLPMRLDDFQKDFIRRVYDNPAGTRLGILSIAKKNGKTGLIASLVLCHVAGPEAVLNSQLVSGAMSRDQAAIVFDYAAKIVNLSPALSRLVRIIPSRKRLVGLARNVEYRALASDGKRIHGISPLVAILDEIGQVRGPRSEFVDAITTSQGAHEQPLVLVISTQAAADTDMLSIWIDDAKSAADPHTVLALYEAPDDCRLDDEAAWKLANPALGTFRSMNDMRTQAEKAQRMPSFVPTFRNLNLNQRVEMSAPFVSRDVWKRGSLAADSDPGSAPVFAGLDLSSVADLTAFTAIWQVKGRWHVLARFWTPRIGLLDRAKRDHEPYDVWADQGTLLRTPGATVDYDYVAAEVMRLVAPWNLRTIAFDRWRIDVLKAALLRGGASAYFLEQTMKPFGQGFQSMGPALDALETELLSERIVHGGNPILDMCAANATVLQDPAGNRKLDKSKKTGRIDGLVALAMAMGAAAAAGPSLMMPTDYELLVA